MNQLNIGLTVSGKTFGLPLDAVTQTFALLAIRGAGKTCTAAVIAEEMCKARLPWLCFDPVGVWWGLRATPDGRPGGFPIVVIGGEHGDIALDKDSGAKIANALASENVSAVLDVSRESKTTWRKFLTELCLELMQLRPETPRHLFIEEAPEFVPQHATVTVTAQCKEAVERLVRLGRNNGYGCTLLSQRPATVDKDVLSQCENIFALRTTGPHDRKALMEWISAQATDRGLEKFVGELAGLANGAAWFWSPHWMNRFERIRIRPRETFHPGATRTVGVAPKAVALADVGEFVDRLKAQLTKVTVPAPHSPEFRRQRPYREKVFEMTGGRIPMKEFDELSAALAERDDFRRQLDQERTARADAEKRLAKVRDSLRPQYDALKALFENLATSAGNGAGDRVAFEPWLAKAGRAGCKRLLEVLIERGELTRAQLGTLSGVSSKSGTFRNYLSWLRRNGLANTEGDKVKLIQL
jgi:uncharacterized protein DUF87